MTRLVLVLNEPKLLKVYDGKRFIAGYTYDEPPLPHEIEGVRTLAEVPPEPVKV